MAAATSELRARLAVAKARAYLRDLELAKTQPDRFARMVDAQGKQLGTPDLWRLHIIDLLTGEDVQAHRAEVAAALLQRLGDL